MNTPFHMIMFKAYHAQRNNIRSDMASYGLSPGQPKVLRYINQHENCMLKDIASNCDVEPATVSKLINGLEDAGMLIREVVKENKRALKLRITESGKQALSLWDIHCHEVEEKALCEFSEDEIKRFEGYLCRMYHNLSGKHID